MKPCFTVNIIKATTRLQNANYFQNIGSGQCDFAFSLFETLLINRVFENTFLVFARSMLRIEM